MSLFPLILSCVLTNAQEPITLDVDATDAPRDVIRSHESIPVKPGAMTLVFPKWIPGHHSPSGPITQLVDLHFSCDGQEVPWRRDDVDMFAFHVDVPAGQHTLDATMATVAPTGTGATPAIAWINFNQVLLYPANTRSDDVPFHATVKLPDGWSFATALHTRGSSPDFETVSLTRLVDSPVLCGAHLKKQMLPTGEGPTHEIDMAGDDDEAVQMPEKTVQQYASLVAEARALFGATHYREYHWLVPVSDTMHGRGLEHNECSEDGASRNVFVGDAGRVGLAGLLAHEYTHSWCGKYRRPAGLATPNYQEPMKGELLYVYEGMTQYWGDVLPARAGLWTKEEFLGELANTAASMEYQSGRTWRSVQDTAVASQISRGIRDGWAAEHRGQDYYFEGVLIWLEADATIRRLSGGMKSLDDFCKAFFGPPSTGPEIRPYTFDDLVKTLNSVQPYDWRTFLRTRLDSTGPHAPLGGIEASGWKLEFTDVPSGRRGRAAGPDGNYRYSLGMSIQADGTIGELVSRMPADQAGLVPGQKAIGINGKVFTLGRMDSALKTRQPIDLTVVVGDDLKSIHIDYSEGLKYPHIVRDESKPDLLSSIIESKARKP
ncbi:MAG TPA: hypothetical protein VG944_11300 [Fimbriimonas sp.]|nr:hypothetical protein [Fimbriimonas sp.]